ncbi:MAG: flagellar hook assembly protein FlgD, partial [Gammaproteobacteria bacterium]
STTSYPVYVSGLVTSVLLGNADGIVLNVDGVGTVNLNDVRRIGG